MPCQECPFHGSVDASEWNSFLTGDSPIPCQVLKNTNIVTSNSDYKYLQDNSTYICGECGHGFSNMIDYNYHQDMGVHDDLTAEDKVKLVWTEDCQNIKDSLTTVTLQHLDTTSVTKMRRGWALKRQRQNKRFSSEVKDYVLSLFEEGEKTVRKYTPFEASKRIRNVRGNDGNRLFLPDEWLTVQQIQGLFSRFAHKPISKSGGIETVDLDLQEVLQDIEQQEQENLENEMVESLCSPLSLE